MNISELSKVCVGPVDGRSPRFEWRGLLVDSARTRYSVTVLKRVIELAARYGFNRLHWHLTDDQGWRFEVPEYPELTSEAAFLPRTRFDDYDSLLGDTRERAVAEQDEKWTNGFYSDAEIAEVVAHADAHGVMVVPEVDLPGHMMAAILSYPELGRPEGVPLPTESMREHMWWPARNDLLWPTDQARTFVEAITRRVAQLFPGPYVHIGGDECAYLEWSSDPSIQDWMALRGVDRVEHLQTWFMDIAAHTLRAEGKEVGVWDEACEIWDDQDALIFAWDEGRSMERIAGTDQRYVFADARNLYFNRVDPDSEAPQKGMVPGITVRDILTVPWHETRDERCIGVQAAVWSEFVLDGDDLLSMLFPRLLAVAERMWSDEIDVDAASARIAKEYAALRAAGAFAAPTTQPRW